LLNRLSDKHKAYFQMHIAVLLYGFTAILGSLISLNAVKLVWWRVLITSVSLFFLIGFGKRLRLLSKKQIASFMMIGVLVGLHWICFFGSIKLANASVALITMASTALFTAIFEPIVNRYKIQWFEILLGILIIPGMLLILKDLQLDMRLGFWVGILAAALAALFSSYNKKLIGDAEPMTITFLELGTAFLFISVIFIFMPADFWEQGIMPNASDWIYLLILALLCTTVAYVLNLKALQHISAFVSNLSMNLEPVYGIILAVVILREDKGLHPSFYFGSVLILLILFIYPFLAKRFFKK